MFGPCVVRDAAEYAFIKIKHAACGGTDVAGPVLRLACPPGRSRTLRAAWRPCSRGPARRAHRVASHRRPPRVPLPPCWSTPRSDRHWSFPLIVSAAATVSRRLSAMASGSQCEPPPLAPTSRVAEIDHAPPRWDHLGRQTHQLAVGTLGQAPRWRVTHSSSSRACWSSPNASRSRARLLAEIRVSGWFSPRTWRERVRVFSFSSRAC